MNTDLLSKLTCNNCYQSSLSISNDSLTCCQCGEEIRIVDGIVDYLTSEIRAKMVFSWADDCNAFAYEQAVVENKQRLNLLDGLLLKKVRGDVLEIGCGTCRLKTGVEKRGAKYFGIDCCKSFLDFAYNEKKIDRIVLAAAELLPFSDESFDSLISGNYAYRYVNADLALAQARRVLKKNGTFVFDILNQKALDAINFKRRIKRFDFISKIDSRKENLEFNFISRAQIDSLAKKNGFVLEDIAAIPISPVFSKLNKWVSKIVLEKWLVYLGYHVIVYLRAV